MRNGNKVKFLTIAVQSTSHGLNNRPRLAAKAFRIAVTEGVAMAEKVTHGNIASKWLRFETVDLEIMMGK